MNPIDKLFQGLRNNGKKAFIPFVTAGDPDLPTSEILVRSLAGCGANLIELGFPYSDPIADGAVIQASYTRALKRGLKIDDIFAAARRLVADPALVKRDVPLVSMVSFSLVYHRGPQRFLEQAKAAGFSGAIVPDLPMEEAMELAEMATKLDFKLIQLITPTTPRERAVQIAKISTGFIYCVSVTGITGERDKLPDELVGQLRWLRGQTDLPICVGFGISKPEHVHMLRDVADGIIIGSALVRKMELADKRPVAEIVNEMVGLSTSLIAALNPV